MFSISLFFKWLFKIKEKFYLDSVLTIFNILFNSVVLFCALLNDLQCLVDCLDSIDNVKYQFNFVMIGTG